MRHTTRLAAVAVAVAGALVLTACGGGDSDADTVAQGAQITTTVAPAPSTTAVLATTSTIAPVTTATAAAPAAEPKVSANNATRAQLAAGFEAAGISNASRWAVEVEEYRPYPTNDPTMAKLRQNLAKYNPGPGVVDAIIATLTLER